MKRSLNLDQLRTFADVIDLGTFSAAADRSNVTQPAVSLQVRQLEKRLGVRLIERVGKRATVTAAGAELLPHARRIDAAVTAALDALAPHATAALGRVRVATGDTACIYVLPAALRDLKRRFPGLDVVVGTGNTDDILKWVEENRIDLGVVTLPVRGRMFDVTPLFDDELVAIASRQAIRLPAVVTPQALARLPLLLYEPGGKTRGLVDQWFARAGFTAKPIMELGSVEAIKKLVEAGLGCSVLPSASVSTGGRGHLDIRSLQPRLKRTLGLVLRRDKLRQRGLREVIAAISALTGDQRNRRRSSV